MKDIFGYTAHETEYTGVAVLPPGVVAERAHEEFLSKMYMNYHKSQGFLHEWKVLEGTSFEVVENILAALSDRVHVLVMQSRNPCQSD